MSVGYKGDFVCDSAIGIRCIRRLRSSSGGFEDGLSPLKEVKVSQFNLVRFVNFLPTFTNPSFAMIVITQIQINSVIAIVTNRFSPIAVQAIVANVKITFACKPSTAPYLYYVGI